MSNLKFYYHITQKKWPNRITLKPREHGDFRGFNEPEIARICVSSSIEGCLIALGSCLLHNKIINIYRTVSKVSSIKPWNVNDSNLTEERWLINSTRFMKVGKINYLIPEIIFNLAVGNISGIKKQSEVLDTLKNLKLNFVTETNSRIKL